jgi:hypothetical protein
VLAEALRDPGLVVAFPRLRGDAWLDSYGAPAKGPLAYATTVVGPAGEPTALLLHDPVLDQEPDVLGAVSAAARLPGSRPPRISWPPRRSRTPCATPPRAS